MPYIATSFKIHTKQLLMGVSVASVIFVAIVFGFSPLSTSGTRHAVRDQGGAFGVL